MTDELKILLEQFRHYRMSPEEQHQQEISFAWGNAHLENPRITREMVEGSLPPALTIVSPTVESDVQSW